MTENKGEWIEVDIKPTPFGGYTCNRKCNKCGYFTREYRLNFCPNCKADMRKNTKRKGTPIEGNNESYNCKDWIP